MNTTIALFLIVLLVLCIGGPLAGLVAVKRAHAFRIEDGHLVAGRWSAGAIRCDIERVAFTAQGSERAGYVGAFVVQTRHAGASGEYIFSVDNIRFRRAPKAELEASIETLRRQRRTRASPASIAADPSREPAGEARRPAACAGWSGSAARP